MFKSLVVRIRLDEEKVILALDIKVGCVEETDE